ncbi:glycine betaine/proline transport system substrate-binding protein [Salsuginibacillus halophilus]|uniref:Glycine betaine/proline transport system substrate-binding protein n=1 Tax=Salsuginibacillus halophilus TaxID=517424 RepID=A0A2P8HQL7_9BACI|nr:glycine betaine ABC transporter substrate-binding protein [Salsuginibacillus halophilus]PSL48509.1 glycine betaine/proline transport system substrate-binding protein [Salsuginibacillus halophilus]
MHKYLRRHAWLPLSLAAVLAACGDEEAEEANGEADDEDTATEETDDNDGEADENGSGIDVDGEEIELAYVAWESELASTNVISQVLEEAGYDVTMTQTDQAPMWISVAEGDADGFVAAWLPSDMAAEYEEYGDDVVDLGPNLEDAITGLAVPDYMDIDSIDELSSDVVGEITGIDAGAGIMSSAEDAIEMYDLDMELSASSDAVMTAELDSRISDEEPVVVTAWQPHWKFNTYDMDFLDDPEGAFGEGEEIRTMVREGLEEDHSEAYQILDNFYWTPDDMNEVMLDISENEMDPEDAAADWIEDNRDSVDEWLDID